MDSSLVLISGSEMKDKLLSALQSRKYKLAKILILGGHNVNVRTRFGITPLMIACNLDVKDVDVYEKLQLISELIECNADVQATDNKGRSSLMYTFHSVNTNCPFVKKYGLHHTFNVQQQRSRKKRRNSLVKF